MSEDEEDAEQLSAPPPRGLASLPDPEAIIFDLDGTLVDTVGTRIAAWLRTFDEVGIPADEAHIARLIGIDGRRLAREVAAVAGRRMDDDRAEAIDRRAGQIYSALNVDPRPLAGATELLEALAESGRRWAIATSSRASQVAGSIAALGLREPPIVVDGGHVALAKPAPDLLLLAAERVGVASRCCWCVGDATWDVRASIGARMSAVAVATGAATRETLGAAGAHAVVDSLLELREELASRGCLGS